MEMESNRKNCSPKSIVPSPPFPPQRKSSRNSLIAQPGLNRTMQRESDTERKPYYQNLERLPDVRPRFRIRRHSFKSPIAEMQHISSEESSGDISNRNKSPKRTGSFALAYQNDRNHGTRKKVPDHLPNQNYGRLLYTTKKEQDDLANVRTVKGVGEIPTVAEIMDDWSSPIRNTSFGNVSIRNRDIKLVNKGEENEIRRSDCKFQCSKYANRTDSNVEKMLEDTLIPIPVNLSDEEDNNSSGSQVTLPPCDDSESKTFKTSYGDKNQNEKSVIDQITTSQTIQAVGSTWSRKRRMPQSCDTNDENPQHLRSLPVSNQIPETLTKRSGTPKRLIRSGFGTKLRDEKELIITAANLQLTQNMDNLNTDMYLNWIGLNCKKHFFSDPAVDIMPLLQKILQQPEVHYIIVEKIKQIRENTYQMERKTTVQLYSMISDVIKTIIQNDFEKVNKVYNSTIRIFSNHNP